jgi:hypothetical protein
MPCSQAVSASSKRGQSDAASTKVQHNNRIHLTGYSWLRSHTPVGDAMRDYLSSRNSQHFAKAQMLDKEEVTTSEVSFDRLYVVRGERCMFFSMIFVVGGGMEHFLKSSVW